MQYLTSQIYHDATPLGTFGNISPFLFLWSLTQSGKVTKRFFKGDGQKMDAQSYLKWSVDSYNNALHQVHLRITTKAYDILKGIYLIHTIFGDCC
jgi:hypothetical protein